MASYVLGIDQSTQGTKVLLFDEQGKICCRVDRPHKQYVDSKGWVEHDPVEIWENVKLLIQDLLEKNNFNPDEIKSIGISNQRETAMAWNKDTGLPIYNAIVWQCARGAGICEAISKAGMAEGIKEATGLPLSPYFSGAKLAWILQNVPEANTLMSAGKLCMGTMDSWLIFKMTKGQEFRTDFSNASRTQLFDIDKLYWSETSCKAFGIDVSALPQVTDSDGYYGETDFDGVLDVKVPIHGVLGDSHAALFGQGCHEPGMAKATYGTGSSVMMNIGKKPVRSSHGLVTSLAWCISGTPMYVLEGNINYTGATISWLKDDLELITGAGETEKLAKDANPSDKSYFVPAFTGLGAPYWESDATGIFTGITRVTGKKEMVRAVLDSIAYQINDVVSIMQQESKHVLSALRVDGGPTKNHYLMQFQTDMLGCPVEVPDAEELSAIGAGYCAGIAEGLYDQDKIFAQIKRTAFNPSMDEQNKKTFLNGWKKAVNQVLWAAKKDSTGKA